MASREAAGEVRVWVVTGLSPKVEGLLLEPLVVAVGDADDAHRPSGAFRLGTTFRIVVSFLP
jgi:hypothetical protein